MKKSAVVLCFLELYQGRVSTPALVSSSVWIAAVAGVDVFVNQNPKENWRPLFKTLLVVTRSHYWSPLISSVHWGCIKKTRNRLTFSGCSGVQGHFSRACHSGSQSCVCFLLACAQRSKVWHWPVAGLHALLPPYPVSFFRALLPKWNHLTSLILFCSLRIQALL